MVEEAREETSSDHQVEVNMSPSKECDHSQNELPQKISSQQDPENLETESQLCNTDCNQNPAISSTGGSPVHNNDKNEPWRPETEHALEESKSHADLEDDISDIEERKSRRTGGSRSM